MISLLPPTRSSLAADLAALGVRPGGVLLVHCSLRAIGWVCGGAEAVVLALRDVLGPDGTLVVPTHTPVNSDPARWAAPPVPVEWWDVIRAETPAFDPARTPSRAMGAVAEQVRTWPGARRSDHPQVSFAALGPRAAEITAGHALDDGLGETSPLGGLYRLGADVLMLGTGWDTCTAFHLAEYRWGAAPRHTEGGAVRGPDGARTWATWEDVAFDESDFELIGADLAEFVPVRTGPAGTGTGTLAALPAVVDFAARWLPLHRV
ncbi:aminoglycoside N(3)-acetyltransferase [Catenuloplanes atrovinosus]|uniref:Aminoglycoside N(3)-acetyltransferase n=1 Tax=Catenuloplanes atrovinosus TaxID=137266 RepID=A0AAE4CEF6_9ACTN|nr:AAC(3) family N-acetyltransferase [Catenuloplanes atrovinosus]MDR7278580.1 aminoglycoside 3-N-acetyltransferase [Catenuloplanes atrovinosus]